MQPETPVSPDQAIYEKEVELWNELDNLAENLSLGGLQFGWKTDQLWHMKFEEFMEDAGGKEKKALTNFLNHVTDRESAKLDSRKTVADHFRIARLFTEPIYNKIVSATPTQIKPSFHQLRRCVFEEADPLADGSKTNQLVGWAIENNWPPVKNIEEQRKVIDPKVPGMTAAEKHLQAFIKLAQIVMAETPVDSAMHNAADAVYTASGIATK